MTRWMKTLLKAAPLALSVSMLALAVGCEDSGRTVEESAEPVSPVVSPTVDTESPDPSVVGSPAPLTAPSPPAEGADVVDQNTTEGPAERAGERVDAEMRNTGKTVGESLDTAGQKASEGLNTAGEKVREGLDTAGEKTDKGLDAAGEKIKEGADEAGSALEKGAQKTEDAIKKGADKAKSVIQKGADKLKEAIDPGEATGEKPADDTP